MAADDTDNAAAEEMDKALRFNRLSAGLMVFGVAAALFLLRPELGLIFLAYVGVSVWSMCVVRSQGILVRPLPLKHQNIAAYVAISSVTFFVALFAVPEVIELFGTVVFILIAVIFAVHVLFDGVFLGGRKISLFRRRRR
ncbi:hypothetical protein [Hoeflea sp.]|uniref:hypothetical protein n=1 Tax=Hoeflea sp. TaxID=1940281 RepID=UPI00374814DF